MSRWIILDSETVQYLINLDSLSWINRSFRANKFFISINYDIGNYLEILFDSKESMETEFNKIKSICLGIN